MDTQPDAPTRSGIPARTVTDTTAPRLSLGFVGIAVRIIVAVALLMAANVVAALVAGAVSVMPGAARTFSGSSPAAIALAFVLQCLILSVVVFGVWAWMRWVERSPIRATGLRWNRLSIVWLLLGIAVAAGSLLAARSLVPRTGTVPHLEDVVGEQGAASVALLVVYYLGLAFIQQSIPEELLFRGWLLWRLRERPIVAIVVTTLAFTVIHLVSNGGQQSAGEQVLYLAVPFGFSLLAVGMLLWTGSLWAAVGVHGGVHIGNYIAAIALPEVDAAMSWLVIGGAQAAIGLALIITGLRAQKAIPAGVAPPQAI